MGFNIGSVFLTLLADGARLEADITKQATAAADKAGQAAGLTLGQQLATGLSKAGKAMTAAGMSLTRNLTVPIVAAGTAIVKTGIDFDTTLRQIVALTDTTASEIGGVKDQILALANATGRDPTELAKGFYFLASAGLDTATALEALDVAGKASASGMGAVSDIAKVVGGVINAYGKENITAAQAGDILTAAIADGAAEASDFAAVIGPVTPIAAAMGVSFDQVAAAVAAMTDANIDADTAVTSLKNVFTSLLKPSSEAEATLEDLGTSSAALRQELKEKGLLATLEDLQGRFEGNDTAIAKVFGNVRALTGITALLGLNQEQLAKIFGDTADPLGKLVQAYEDTEGPGRQLDRAITEIKTTLIDLSTDVLPPFLGALKAAADLIRAVAGVFKSLPEPVRGTVVELAGFAAVLGPTLVILGKISSGLGASIKLWGKLGGAIATIGPQIAAGLASAWRAAAASSVLGPVITAAASAAQTVYLRALYLGDALNVAVSAAWTRVAGSRIVLAAANSAGLAAGMAFVAGVTGLAVVVGLAQGIQDLWKNITGVDLHLEPSLQGQVDKLKSDYDAKYGPEIQALLHHGGTSAGKAFGDGLLPEMQSAGKDASAALTDGLAQGSGGINSGLNYATDAVRRFGLNVQTVLKAAGNRSMAAFAQAITDARQAPLDAFDNLVEMLKHPLNKTGEISRLTGQLVSKELAAGMKSQDPAIRAAAQAVKQSIIDRLNEIGPRANTISKESAKAIAEGLRSKDPDIRREAQRISDLITGTLQDTVAPAGTAGAAAGTRFMTELQRAINGKVVTATIRTTSNARIQGVNAFAEGTPFVPYDQLAYIHRREMIIPAAQADQIRSGTGGIGGGGVTIGTLNLNGIGSDVSPASAKRFGQAVLDEVAAGLRQQRARSV